MTASKNLPLIRRRARPWTPWGEWYRTEDLNEFDLVLEEEYNWGKNTCSEHQKEKPIFVQEDT